MNKWKQIDLLNLLYAPIYTNTRTTRNIINCRLHCRRPGTIQTDKNNQVWENMDTKNSIHRPTKVWTHSWWNHRNRNQHSLEIKLYHLKKLQQEVIRLEYKSSHTEKRRLERRIRSHFFLYNRQSKVAEFVNVCPDCKDKIRCKYFLFYSSLHQINLHFQYIKL